MYVPLSRIADVRMFVPVLNWRCFVCVASVGGVLCLLLLSNVLDLPVCQCNIQWGKLYSYGEGTIRVGVLSEILCMFILVNLLFRLWFPRTGSFSKSWGTVVYDVLHESSTRAWRT